MIAPAAMKRVEAAKSGGIVSPGVRDAEVRRAPDHVDRARGRSTPSRACVTGLPNERERRADSAAARSRARAAGEIAIWSTPNEPEAVDHRAHHELAGDQDPDRRRRADPRLGERDRADDGQAHQAADPHPRRRAERVAQPADPAAARRRADRRRESSELHAGRERERLEDADRPPKRPITATCTEPASPARTASATADPLKPRSRRLARG